MVTPTGYILCATPRTGSTFLCSLLASTGVLGRPESYFREPDEVTWAASFGLPTVGRRVQDYQSFVQAVRCAATTENGVFGARVMWGTVERIVQGLDAPAHQSDLATLQAVFGPLVFVHLQREDSLRQAVSWARAEQTGYWQEGDVVQRSPEPDVGQLVGLAQSIREHNTAWRTWFADNGIEPLDVTYEGLVGHPHRTLTSIADLLGIVPPLDWRPGTPPRKQADRVNEEWHAPLRSAENREHGEVW
ncbi:conserved hypothetical protein [metagenome]|uniref:Sulphotransferase Stf0 domain-containing protein n=1 Tax=metagenome TaxID=256318 RepID=A0A2P2BZQ8_9ZZZZ